MKQSALIQTNDELERRVIERTAELELAIGKLRNEVALRERTDNALTELARGTATVTGEEFFPALVRHLALSLGVRYALVAECVDRRADRVRSLAWWVDDKWDEPIEYDVGGTPCEEVVKQGRMCYYPDHVQELFPADTPLVAMDARCYLGTPLFDVDGKSIGHLFVIDDKPLLDPERTKSIISIFAARAAMELQRKHAESALQDLVEGTAAVTADEFFPALVKHLAHALSVRIAVAAECTDPSFTHARVLARWEGDQWSERFEYPTHNTPCEVVLQSGAACLYRDQVQAHFPGNDYLPANGIVSYLGVPLFDPSGKTIGHLYVMDQKPLRNEARAKSIMGIFAARAAMELHRKHAEERIRDQAKLLDEAHDAIMVMGLDERIIYWNKGSERLYGWTAEEVSGRNPFELLHTEGTVQLDGARRQVAEQGDWAGELRQNNRAGKPLIVDSRWTLVRGSDGDPRSILQINYDITERKALEAQFLRTQRMESIGTLASGVAHDLNNILTPITLASETLRMATGGKHRRDLVSMIETNAKRGADIVHQVLSFARGVEGERKLLQLAHLMHEIEKIARETFPKSIRTTVQIPAELWPISGDATQLHQVLLNLSVNARDAMPTGGVVSITAENVKLDEQYARMHADAKPGPYVIVKVSDTGTGIPRDVMAKIFDPFFTTKEIGKGTGLGLSTSLAIVKGHGGFLAVYSEEGRGSTFQVFLPALEGKAGPARAGRRESLRGRGELILIVDDEQSILDITRSTLIANGYRASVAADGTEAVAHYAANHRKVKLVLMDMMMPFLDGPATIRALRKLNPRVRIIATSGLMTTAKIAEATEAGVNDVLAKPYTSQKLLSAIKKVLPRDEVKHAAKSPGHRG
jgi:PAS domain S-box-containing protein